MNIKKYNFKEFDFSKHNVFFKSLREDYLEFDEWIKKKKNRNENFYALIEDESKLKSFLYLKFDDNEEIRLNNGLSFSKEKRLKIGTLKIDPTYKNRGLGKFLIEYSLRCWQKENVDSIYITVFSKHKLLLNLLYSYGFINYGELEQRNDEYLLLKSKKNMLNWNNKVSFPYIYKKNIDYIYIIKNNDDLCDNKNVITVDKNKVSLTKINTNVRSNNTLYFIQDTDYCDHFYVCSIDVKKSDSPNKNKEKRVICHNYLRKQKFNTFISNNPLIGKYRIGEVENLLYNTEMNSFLII